jgi:acyl carrier protein
MTIDGTPRETVTDLTGTVIRSLAGMTNRDPATITPEMRFFEDLAFDSTNVLELLMQLETDLDVEFDPDTLEPADFATISALVSYVAQRVEARG